MSVLTPQQIAILKQQLNAGRIPSNVAALPMGMQPPGAIHLGPVGPSIQGEHPLMAHRERMNPIAPEDEGLAQIRAISECNIPEESAKLRGLLDRVLKLDTSSMDEDDLKQMDRTLGDGILVGITANRHCRDSASKRLVVTFEKDPKLSAIHKDFLAKEKEVLELKKKMDEARNEAIELLKERWETACKNHGLDPKSNFYQIDEDRGIIYQVELRCDKCKGAKRIRKARVSAEALIDKHDKTSKESLND
jgi:hypothetical protein